MGARPRDASVTAAVTAAAVTAVFGILGTTVVASSLASVRPARGQDP